MQERVATVKAILTFKFNNVSIPDLVMYISKDSVDVNKINYLTSIDIIEKLSSKDVNPVGNVMSSSLSTNIVSIDGLLIPDNSDSIYYGFMNDTAVIKVVIVHDSTNITFGTYFVESWSNSTSSSAKNAITVTAKGILSKVNDNNIKINNLYIENSISENLKLVVADINSNLSESDRIIIDNDRINFNPNELKAINIDSTNVSGYLNTLSKCTLTNICIDRSNVLYTDDCCDDIASESVCSISENNSILTAKLNNSSLLAYSGVCVKSSVYVVNDTNLAINMEEQALIAGVTTFEDLALGGAFKVNYISVVGSVAGKNPIVSDVYYTKKTISFKVTSEVAQNCNIYVYCQKINESFKEVSVYKENKNGVNVYTVTNSLLASNYINTYANNILKLFGLKANSIDITGSFNPRIKLSDTVYVDCTKTLNVSGYYKVVGLSWNMAAVLKCTMSLIKVNLVEE